MISFYFVVFYGEGWGVKMIGFQRNYVFGGEGGKGMYGYLGVCFWGLTSKLDYFVGYC